MYWQAGSEPLQEPIHGRTSSVVDRFTYEITASGKNRNPRIRISLHVPISTRDFGVLRNENLKRLRNALLNLHPADAAGNGQCNKREMHRLFRDQKGYCELSPRLSGPSVKRQAIQCWM